MNIKISMDIGVSASSIHESYTSANQWSTVAGSFSTSYEAEIKLKMRELSVMAYNSAPFYVTRKNTIMM